MDSTKSSAVALTPTSNQDRPSDPMLPPGSGFCKCTLCGLYFKNVRAFGKHRVGPGGDRRCMPRAGCREAGLELDSRGYWRLPKQEFRSVHLKADNVERRAA